ncbi:MAG: LamG-like jellyroll fold domain-containing protein [Candidatus Eisenbacteria bacterium]|nr:LamG-like jellyroll fold domain-containing protein [Candidatus Eisenbacteria bacterium]
MSRFSMTLAIFLLAATGGATTATAAPPDTDCCGYTVMGNVWYDQNADGIKQLVEPPLAGWSVEVFDSTNTLVTTLTTDALGYYSTIAPVGCGNIFILKQVVQPGWTQSFPPSSGFHTGLGTGCGPTFGPYDFGNKQPNCLPFTKTYTLDADFNLGTLSGIVTNSDQLELSPTSTTWQFAWIANASEGTISKVNTQTGKEVGRYYTGPADGGNGYGYLSPSRTVVDVNGDCWVANRNLSSAHFASVTQIVTSGGIDWNSNTIIDTATDSNNNGQIDPWEILPWGQDERVVRHYLLGSTIGDQARAMVIDKAGYLWVGLCITQQLVKVDATLPTATYSANNPSTAAPSLVSIPVPLAPHTGMPYGMALSPNGKLYMSTVNSKAFEIDPGLVSGGTIAGPAITETINHGGSNYGIAVDQNCIVWLAIRLGPGGQYGCIRWDPTMTLGNPLLGWTISNPGAPGIGRGITVDFNNEIWMACNDSSNSVVKFSNTPVPNVIGVYPTPSDTPVGVGAAEDGHIIVTPSHNSLWCKIDVNTGAQIPLPGPELVGYGPYTYSDFTGSQMNMTGLQQGIWSVITDGGSSLLAWNFIGWNELTPVGTSVLVEARIAATLPALAAQSWTIIGTSGPLGSPIPGRYIETRVRLQRSAECGVPFVTPVLYDLTVSAICNICTFATCPSDTTIPCTSPQGAEFSWPVPIMQGSCDSTWTVNCSPSPGYFSVGTTPVICTAVNAENDTVICQFNVTVAGGCDPPPTGACCTNNFCTITTLADCEQSGGIYFGDGTDCTSGCDQNCVEPPNNLAGWWPLDIAPGGITPSLTSPFTGGTMINGPTPLPGEQVANSYRFNGVNQSVLVPHHISLDIGPGDVTVDAWIRTTQSQGVATLIDKRNASPIQGFVVFLNNGYPGLQLAVGGGFTNYGLSAVNGGAPAFVADGLWHLVAVTLDRDDPAGLQFYVDGNPVGTPLNPTGRMGSLNSAASLLMAGVHPALGGRHFAGDLDEVELIRRELGADEIYRLYEVGAAGKCPESCYATKNALCCNGLTSGSSVTICNYSLVPHTYSWGVSPLTAGPGCGPIGPSGFFPTSGTVTVPAQGCVTVPIQVACPSGVPVGQTACYQVQIFNHDTGRLFGCTGSVRRAKKWCWQLASAEIGPIGILGIYPGVPRPIEFEVKNLGEGNDPESIDYMIRPLAGDTGLPSAGVSLNGLPPGEPIIGTRMISPGESEIITVLVSYPDASPIGHDRLLIDADEDGDTQLDPITELAVRSVLPGTSSVPGEDPVPAPAPVDSGRLLLVFPNPFSASDQIRFRVEGDRPQDVKLRLFDPMGRLVKSFYYEMLMAPGEHTVNWNTMDGSGQPLRSGIYFLKLEVGHRSESIKLMVRP